VRVNAVNHRETGWREFTFNDLDAVHVTAKAQPFTRTVVQAEYERFNNDDAVARPLTYWSQTDTWDAAGRPLVNTNFAGRTNTALNPGLNVATLAQLSANNYWIFTEQDGNLLNWRGMSRSNRANFTNAAGQTFTAFADFRTMALQPEGVVSVNTMGPGTGRNLDLENAFASWQQQITKSLHVELAGSWQYSDWRSRRIPATTVFADPNAFLPAGGANSTGPAATPVPNPFRGEYYTETVAQFWRTTAEALYFRASASYDFKLPGMFGQHRLGLLWQQDEYETRTRSLREMVLLNGVPASLQAANVANDLARRYYITDRGNPKEYRNSDVTRPGIPLNVTLADGTRLTSQLYQYTSAPADYIKDNDVMMAVLQSRWWKDRVHTVVGVRKDDVTFDDWGSYVSDGAGAFVRSNANRSIVPYSGTTRNYSIVYHAFERLSLFANYSSSYGVPGLKIIYAPTGQFMEPMQGIGHDYGIKFSIPKFRLEGSLSYYDASSTNETDNQAVESWGVNGHNSFLDALVAANLMSASAAAPLRATGTGDTVDSSTEGVEFSLAGSITNNWDLRFNYSYTERSLSNAFPRVNAWAEEQLRPFWATWNRDNPNTPAADNILDTVLSGTNSLRTLIENFETNLATRGRQRAVVTGLRPHKANVFTTYALKEGWLRGVRVGGGVRYEAANYVGVDSAGRTLRGRSFTNVDLMSSYTRKIFGRPTTLQVNVRNVFRDDPAVGPSVINASGNWDTIIINPPRSVTFSLRVAY
jgi:iron complex outermembrane receptor protein